MITCPTCQHEQVSGKFCGACGAAMQENARPDAASTPQAQGATEAGPAVQVQPSQASGNATHALGDYWHYLLGTIKNPTHAFRSGERDFSYGLINIALFLVTFALGIYFLINSLVKSMSGFGGLFDSEMSSMNAPFFGIFFRVLLVGLIFAAISYVSSIAMAKLAKSPVSMKEFIAQFGGLFVPFAGVGVLTILSGLAGSLQITLALTLVSFAFITFILPAVMVLEKGRDTTDQNVYLSLGASLLAVVVSYIMVRSYIVGMVEELGQLMSFL
ncbi:hypothetical protein [Virgibacillus sediminis]|uniref:Zinc ribbon domain-containing protein n=1 Tax=Virgibacillus sediminis TaxID=202260 RepID=A0ABV7A8D0_9BACI